MRGLIMGLGAIAGLFGAAGVGLAAAGAHIVGGTTVTTAAYFLLLHASALIALCTIASVSPFPRGVCVAATGIAIGTILFSGDLAMRGLAGITVARLAAPTGGVILIVGWLLAAATIPMSFRKRPPRSDAVIDDTLR